MELLWEYTFPASGLVFHVVLQAGAYHRIGVAMTSHVNMPQGDRLTHGVTVLPQSVRSTLVSLFEGDYQQHTMTLSTMALPTSWVARLHIAHDYEHLRWLAILDHPARFDDVLDLYEILPNHDPQWRQLALMSEEQIKSSAMKRTVAFWQSGTSSQCLWTLSDHGEEYADRLFWTHWTRQGSVISEETQRMEACDIATTFIRDERCLLFLYQRVYETPPSSSRGQSMPGRWQLRCMAYDIKGQLSHEEILPRLGMPIRNTRFPSDDLHESFHLDLTTGPGPLLDPQNRPTAVLAVRQERVSAPIQIESAGSDQSSEPIMGQLVWMDMQGQFLHTIESVLGNTISLCCCGEWVIGADQMDGRWRLWQWQPGTDETLDIIQGFPQEVRRVTVIALEPNAAHHSQLFWCLEEYDLGLRVVQRTYKHKKELEVLWFEDFVPLFQRKGIGLKVETCLSVLSPDGYLLLVGNDQEGQLKLLTLGYNLINSH